MKSEMPFLGIMTTPLRKTCKAFFDENVVDNAAAWRKAVLAIWRGAKFREERYAAIELTGYKRYRDFQTLDALPMYEEMIVTGAWWDYVDAIAVHRVGKYLLRDFPARMKREMRKWSVDDDMWKRRTSILCQITFKADTDLELLFDCIEPSLQSKEFFLRKAIGWALRQHAWTDPHEIKRFVTANRSRLSALSFREATKNIAT